MFKFACILFTILLAAAPLLAQEPSPSPEPATIQFNFPNGIDIPSLIEYVKKFAPKPIGYDPAILAQKVVALESEHPIAPEQLMPLFRALLEVAGLALVEEGPVFKVVPASRAALYALPIFTYEQFDQIPPEDRVVVQVFPLAHISASDAMKALVGLVPPKDPGTVSAVPGANMLLIIASATRARFFADLMNTIDVPGQLEKFDVIRLEYARAENIADKLQTFFQSTSSPVKITADQRSKSLIVRASLSDLEQIRAVAKALDVDVTEPSEFHFYKMQYAKAESLAPYLNEALSQAAEADDSDHPPSRIIAVPDRNSLIIRATDEEYAEIEQVIKQLDKRKRQVFTRAALIEIATDNLFDIGVELATIDEPGSDPRGFGFSLHDLSTITVGASPDPTITRLPAVTSGLIFGITKESAALIPFLLRAAEKDIDANIIAMPQLASDDNETATFKTADAVPTVTFTTTETTTDVRSFGGFQEAQILLKVTPSITSKDNLILDIELTVEQFVGKQIIPELPPPKISRTVTAKVTVPNNLTVVIGGLKNDSTTDEVSRVPILGRIPVLGFLFRRTTSVTLSRTLYMFLTPTIESFEEGAETIKALTEEKIKELEDQGANTEALPKNPPLTPPPTPEPPLS
jgi:general secretion pathway protein D